MVRPQSVADMEELGRNLENMQIVNSRFGRDEEDDDDDTTSMDMKRKRETGGEGSTFLRPLSFLKYGERKGENMHECNSYQYYSETLSTEDIS